MVVVDDGSVDATPHELRALDDGRVQVIRHERPRGVSAARNIGLAEVTAPWVAFLDDDDVWAPGHLAAMLRAAGTSGVDPERVGLVFSGSLLLDADWNVSDVSPAPPAEGARDQMSRRNYVGCPSRVMVRTEAVHAVGGFDERLSLVADWDLWVRVLARYEPVRCPDLLVGYMIHKDNMHLDGDQFLDELAVIQEKYGWPPRRPRTPVWPARSRPGDMVPGYVAAAYRARGRRVRSARWYLRSFRMDGDRRDLARAAGVLLGERMIDLSGLRAQKFVDPSLGGWLEHVRQAARAGTAGRPPLDQNYRNSLQTR